MDDASPDFVPPTIPGYRLRERLGAGGMGIVYRAEQEHPQRTVALKIMRRELGEQADQVQRFLREADTLAQIRHPNVVSIHDAGEVDGCLYQCFSYIEGGDLGQWIDAHGAMPEAKALGLIAQCLDGLQAIHAAGLIHRDIKPGNIFLSQGEPVIGDFGLARAVDNESQLTLTGTAVGTPAFMSPEQIRDTTHVDGRADVYALGATLFTLVTGSLPFTGNSPYEVTHTVLNATEVPDPRRIDGALSESAVAIVRKAMALDRDTRYADAAAMKQDITAALAGRSLVHALGGRPAARAPSQPPAAARHPGQGLSPRPGRGFGPRPPPLINKRLLMLLLSVFVIGWLAYLPSLLYMDLSRYQPDWATAYGRDSRGPWADLSFGHLPAWRFRYVQAAPALIGAASSDASAAAHEGQREARLTGDYWLASSELSRAQLRSIMGREGTQAADGALAADSIDAALAQDILARLRAIHRGLPIRLPTESEWEFACRAGSDGVWGSTAGTWSYPQQIVCAQTDLQQLWEAYWEGSADFAVIDEALAAGIEHQGPRTVGQGLANTWGFYDMHGNVAEICQDDHDPDSLLLKGGSWIDHPERCHAAAREALPPSDPHHTIGLRLLIPVPAADQDRPQ